jgi:hypothetical protein
MKGERKIRKNKKKKQKEQRPLYLKGHIITEDMHAEKFGMRRDHMKESLKAIYCT